MCNLCVLRVIFVALLAICGPSLAQAQHSLEGRTDRLGIRLANYRFGVDENPSWSAAHDLLALVQLYDATRDARFLETAAGAFDAALAGLDSRSGLLDEVRGTVMPGWGNRRYSGGLRHAWLVHAGILTYPMLELARRVAADPVLEPRLGAAARRYTDHAAGQIAAFWRDARWQGDRFYFAYPDEWAEVDCGAASEARSCERFRGRAGKPLPFNMMQAMGLVLLSAWQLDPGRFPYRDEVTGMARLFKDSATRVPCPGETCPDTPGDYYVWPYGPGGRTEDISHGGLSMRFVAEVTAAGLGVFGPDDLEAYANTFRTGVLKGQSVGELDPVHGVARHVDGSGEAEPRRAASCIRWLHLASVAPDLVGLCRRIYEGNGLALDLSARAYFELYDRPRLLPAG